MIGYSTVEELIQFGADRGVDIDPSAGSIALRRALDWLEIQPLIFDPEDVPAGIVKAQRVCALIYAQGGDPLSPFGPRVTAEAVSGAVSVSYSDSGPMVPIYPELEALIAPFRDDLGAWRGTYFRVDRG